MYWIMDIRLLPLYVDCIYMHMYMYIYVYDIVYIGMDLTKTYM